MIGVIVWERPFLVALNATLLVHRALLVYRIFRFFANRILSKKGGDLREVLVSISNDKMQYMHILGLL
jgi:hypothetical protein